MVIRQTKGDRAFDAINLFFLALILIFCAYPIWFVLCASISEPRLVNSGQMLFFPQGVTWSGYQALFRESDIAIGYRNTIFYTVVGTLINLAVTLPAAYALSRKDFVGRNVLTGFFLFTMFFSGGMIPNYLIVQKLHMVNTIWAMLLLGATSMYNIILCRTFFVNSIPGELQDAAEIDGCTNFQLFTRIVLPLSKPIIAVMVLFFAISHWNSYFTAMLYITDDNLKPLQLVLQNILVKSDVVTQMMENGQMDAGLMEESVRITQLIRYSLIVTASLPVMCLYPFVQKYFVKGVMLGAIKG
jgi:putative aldouronate transport system permease protein